MWGAEGLSLVQLKLQELREWTRQQATQAGHGALEAMLPIWDFGSQWEPIEGVNVGLAGDSSSRLETT